MGKFKKIKNHISSGTIFKRIGYQFSGLKKWEDFKKSDKNFMHFKISSRTQLKLYKESYLSFLIIRGDFEKNEIRFFKNYIKKTDRILDIGSNIGLFTCLAAEKAEKVYAFEPTPPVFDKLNENIKLNSLRNCESINKALSDSSGTVEMNISTDGMDAWNTLGNVEEKTGFKKVQVQTITLDDFYKENKWKPSYVSLIKIDVEGWEMNVLKGAEQIISADDAPDILIEITDKNLLKNNVSGNLILNHLKNFGYHLYELTDRKLKPHSILNDYDYCNIFCSKNPSGLKNRKLI